MPCKNLGDNLTVKQETINNYEDEIMVIHSSISCKVIFRFNTKHNMRFLSIYIYYSPCGIESVKL